jgi:hypothetical protein
MNIPVIFEVLVGLVFIYLAFSLLASEAQELLATLLQWRAKHLRDSIKVLLAGGVGTEQETKVNDLVQSIYENLLVKNINQEPEKGLARSIRNLTRLIPLGNRQGSFGDKQTTGPSYIAAETFAATLLDRVGLPSLSRTLIEVRLDKFATRIIGEYKGGLRKSTGKPPEKVEIDSINKSDLWKVGRIRQIAIDTGWDINSDSFFELLLKEIDEILYDFESGDANLATSVECMSESFGTYIDNLRDLNNVSNANNYAKRLQSLKQRIFGEQGERAILSGGLRPSLLEFSELLDTTSKTFEEIENLFD